MIQYYLVKALSIGAIACLSMVTTHHVLAQEGIPDGNPTAPGGTRPELPDTCEPTEQSTIALVPSNGVGGTSLAQPTLMFFVPYTSETIDLIEFVLLNQSDTEEIYRTTLELASTPGIYRVELPESAVLDMDEVNHWYLAINCEPKEGFAPSDLTLDGWIYRTTSDATQEWNGVWFDALTELDQRYQNDPENPAVQTDWRSLLESVGLQDLSEFEIVN